VLDCSSMDDRPNIFFPLWIDGGLSRGLLEGAKAIRDRLSPRLSFEEFHVEDMGDPRLERGIVGYAAIRSALERASEDLERLAPERLLTVGGGCGIEVAILPYLCRRYPGLRVLWLDAHGDLNSPASSPSKHFHGMPLRFLLEGSLDPEIGPRTATIAPSELTLIGCRDLDPPEAEYIRERRIRLIPAEEAGRAELAGRGEATYIHLDLDVLDPALYPNVKCPAPGGLAIAEAAALVARTISGSKVVGMSILENLATNQAALAKLEPILELAERI
jgi:arginase